MTGKAVFCVGMTTDISVMLFFVLFIMYFKLLACRLEDILTTATGN